MAGIEETIDVDASPERAYAVWADFACYPDFVKGVERVERHGDRLHWVAGSRLKTSEWDAHITAEEPGRRIAWRAPEGPIDTEITFEALPDGGTRVLFREHMHDSRPPKPRPPRASAGAGRRTTSSATRRSSRAGDLAGSPACGRLSAGPTGSR
jgi:hypothetical protein